MRNTQSQGILGAALALRAHIVALFTLAYFLFCLELDGRLSGLEAFCGAGFALLLLTGYAVNRLSDREEDSFNGDLFTLPGGPGGWRRMAPAVFAVTSAAMFLAAPALWPVLVYSALAAFAYGHPVLRLKRRLLVKPLINTLNFFAVAVAAPFALHDPGAWSYLHMQVLATWRLLGLVLCLTVFLDVRDAEGDAKAGIRTLPVVLGRKPVLAVIAAFSLFSGVYGLGVDGTGGTLAQLAMSGFALGAMGGKRTRGYYDGLVLALAASLALSLRK